MKRHEITVTTQELYTAFAQSLFDCPEVMDGSVVDTLRALAHGNMDGIRKAFTDGYVPMMAPQHMEFLDSLLAEDEVEFRVTHRGTTIGVVINSEVHW